MFRLPLWRSEPVHLRWWLPSALPFSLTSCGALQNMPAVPARSTSDRVSLKDLGSTKSILFWLPQVSLSFLQSVCFGGKSSACINNMINAISTYLPISACTPDQFHSKAFSWDYSYVTKNGLPYGRFSIFTFFSSSQNSFLFISVSNQKTILNMSRSVLRPSRFSQVISVASPL